MNIKLTYYNITHSWNNSKISHGTQVCPCNGATSVGTIVDISKRKQEYRKNLPATVTVLWGTGKKRGKKTLHPPENLINFTEYLAAVKDQYDELQKLQDEAKSMGM